MTRLEPTGWRIRRLFSRPSRQSSFASKVETETDATVVRLIDAPRRLPATPIEQGLVSTLRKIGPVSVASLVRTVAADLYAEEVRKGAGVLDIGLFGSRLFNGEVVRELKAGDGGLWEIIQERKSTALLLTQNDPFTRE